MITAKLLLISLLQSTDVSSARIDPVIVDHDEAYCLAQTIYYEARAEDVRGQYAVAQATLNRVNDPRFPKTVCKVVKQVGILPSGKKTCAFSWYCDGASDDVPVRNKKGEPNRAIEEQFRTASMIALIVMYGTPDEDVIDGATHFHNPSISKPRWAKVMLKTASIGRHDFYRLRPLQMASNSTSITTTL